MEPVNAYFSGERLQCSIGILLGVTSIGLALYFLLEIKTGFYKGMAYPFLIIPLLLIVICAGVVLRTPQDIARVSRFMEQERDKIQMDEMPRMQKVMQNFRTIKVAEICLLLAGLAAFAYGTAKGADLTKGIGLGLAIQSALMFGFDYFAHHRAKIYWEFLQGL